MKSISKNIKIFQSHYIIKNYKKFKNKNILAFAGIGNPDSFFTLLEKVDLKLRIRFIFQIIIIIIKKKSKI